LFNSIGIRRFCNRASSLEAKVVIHNRGPRDT
jgi:hypothetical protein